MSRTSAKARATAAAEKRGERSRARACSNRFLLDGEPHEGCVRGEPCSREYDPSPAQGSKPLDMRPYYGTGIGALYGGAVEVLSSGRDPDTGKHRTIGRSLVADLAGWNVKGMTTHDRKEYP